MTETVVEQRLEQSAFARRWDFARARAPGVLVAATIAVAATFLSEHYTAPVMVYALLIGMAFNFLNEEKGRSVAGIEFSSKTLLRLAVGLLGVQITFADIMRLGLAPVLTVVSGVLLTIGFGMAMARVLKVDRNFGILTSGAVAICGASAAMAISSVLPRSERLERDTVFTVIGVTTLSTLAMVLYPIVISAFHLDHAAVGMFLGGTIHDVAQVVGAGYSVSEETGNVATFTKLLRVAMLLPVVVTLALSFRSGAGEGGNIVSRTFPSFLLLFAALVIISSLGILPVWATEFIKSASRWLLVTAIAALGMKTSLKSILTVGGRAIALIVLETVFLALFVLAIVLWLHM
jgi:uncharacterized integral membrane protein (TIGR00698 family)